MRRIAVLIAPIVLAGCAALPPQLALLTQAADGVSYVFTGKSGTDQIVSAALSRDCVVIRAVQGEAICKDRFEDTELGQSALQIQGGRPGAAFDGPAAGDQLVALDHGISLSEGAAQPDDGRRPATARPVPLLPASGEAPLPPPAAAAPAETRGAGQGYYVVVGDYRDFDRALERAGRHRSGIATIVTATRRGSKTHRVMIGPFGLAAAREARRVLPLGEDRRTAWLARACASGASPGEAGGCLDLEKTWR
jgi:hypothetical protein